MILYCVENQYDYECNTLLGVFSTLKLAKEFLDKTMDYSGLPDRYFLYKVELNIPITCMEIIEEIKNVK